MKDYRQILTVFAIAVLFTIFVQTLIDPFISYDYEDCFARPLPFDQELSEEERLAQNQASEDCFSEQERLREKEDLIAFIVSVVIGLFALLAGLYLQVESPIGIMITNGLVLGGLITIFIGTTRGWQSIGELVRPFVMLVELGLVILVAYKRLNDTKQRSSAKALKHKK